jgi:integrase
VSNPTPEQVREIKRRMRKKHIRAVSWEPVQVGNRWRLNVPPSVSPTGRRQQLFFKSREAAEDEAGRLRDTRRTFGDLLTKIDPHELSEAVKALELLRSHNVSLLECVTSFLADRKRRSESHTLAEAFDAYKATRGDWSTKYAGEIHYCRRTVSDLLDVPLSDITAEDLESALAGIAPSNRNAKIKRLRSVFSEAVRQGWITSSPADRLNLTVRKVQEVRTYAVGDVQAMLQRALNTDRMLVPFLAIGAFCGLRPENELANLLWDDVHLDDEKPQIVIRPETSKTRRRRFVDVSPNCIAWIRAAGVQRVGKVFPASPKTLQRKRIALCAANQEKEWKAIAWIPDGFRHTFCSAYLTKHESVDRLLLQTGHTDPAILWRHYYRSMTKADSATYWEIRPKG